MFKFFPQHDAMDCGPACLQMVAAHYGKKFTLRELRNKSHLDREGVSLAGIKAAATAMGFRCMSVKIPFAAPGEAADLLSAPLPAIVHWRADHFVVLYKKTKKYIWIADPAYGRKKMSHSEFNRLWKGGASQGIALLLEPTPDFYQREAPGAEPGRYAYLLNYLKPHRKLLLQLAGGMFVGSIIQLVFPFLTQAIVDVGIENQDLNFIWLILIGQLVLFGGQSIVQFIQSWIVLHISTRVNVSMIADFLYRLMRLPLRYFDTIMTGDLLQRISDHRRIEVFLTEAGLRFIFSAFNLIVFGLVLWIYDSTIFSIFLFGALAYSGWIFIFLKKRKQVDYQRFQQLSDNQSSLIEIIQGMPEIKLQNSEEKRRNKWTDIQSKLFRANMRSLTIAQYQDAGAIFINQLKDIIITFVAAAAVIRGDMTLGMLLAVQYIVGMVNAPLQQLIGFIRTAQDAGISFDRMQEIRGTDTEYQLSADQWSAPPLPATIYFKNVWFRYNPLSKWVLEDVSLEIPWGKTTAIVGMSGSGKTTLIKLLLGFYKPQRGQIQLGNINLEMINPATWRTLCGAVMQDGFIFSDTLAANIAESYPGDDPPPARIQSAADAAALTDFIASMPLGYQTKVGTQGHGLSAGQRQRLLIARAIFKNPEILIMDEATNALDAHHEKIIVKQLGLQFQNKTKIIIAHRLSTVREADQIIVMEQGQIAERGHHAQLIRQKGKYFELVKEQLQLGE